VGDLPEDLDIPERLMDLGHSGARSPQSIVHISIPELIEPIFRQFGVFLAPLGTQSDDYRPVECGGMDLYDEKDETGNIWFADVYLDKEAVIELQETVRLLSSTEQEPEAQA
jgi:hypothetical protein